MQPCYVPWHAGALTFLVSIPCEWHFSWPHSTWTYRIGNIGASIQVNMFSNYYREGDWLASLNDATLWCLPKGLGSLKLATRHFYRSKIAYKDLPVHRLISFFIPITNSLHNTHKTHNIQTFQNNTTPTMVHYMFLTRVCSVPPKCFPAAPSNLISSHSPIS